MEFYEFIGETRDVASRPDTDLYAIRSLLSVKYLINQDGEDRFTDEQGITEMPGFNYIYNTGGFDVYENANYVGYGFSYDAYMTYSQCESMGDRERANMMLRAILLDEEQINKYGYMFDDLSTYYSKGNSRSTGYSELKEDAARRNATAATSFKTGRNSFTATVEREKATLVFFSIPYDEGWSATVNGKEVPVEKVNVGFMAVPVEAGSSNIVFTYKTPGLAVGAAVSGAALAVLAVYIAAVFVYRKKHTTECVYPEGDELLSIWEAHESAELAEILLEESLPEEIEITEEQRDE